MKIYVKSAEIGKQKKSRLIDLIDAFNDSEINTELYESKAVCRLFDTIAREQGLEYGKDFMCPPFQEDCIVKLSNCKVHQG